MKLVDAHCHLYGFDTAEIDEIFNKLDIVIVAVSEDIKTAERVLSLKKRFNKIVPCIGLHPWNVSKNSLDEVDELLKLKNEVVCFGEIGLDKRFNAENFEHQVKVFEAFLDEASSGNYVLNLHTLDAWHEVLKLLKRYDIEKAIFHGIPGP